MFKCEPNNYWRNIGYTDVHLFQGSGISFLQFGPTTRSNLHIEIRYVISSRTTEEIENFVSYIIKSKNVVIIILFLGCQIHERFILHLYSISHCSNELENISEYILEQF
jgi:hypothetical protein